LIELVLVIEDLGVDLYDDIDWPTATFIDLYRAYVAHLTLPTPDR
jgi:hypothetical protein